MSFLISTDLVFTNRMGPRMYEVTSRLTNNFPLSWVSLVSICMTSGGIIRSSYLVGFYEDLSWAERSGGLCCCHRCHLYRYCRYQAALCPHVPPTRGSAPPDFPTRFSHLLWWFRRNLCPCPPSDSGHIERNKWLVVLADLSCVQDWDYGSCSVHALKVAYVLQDLLHPLIELMLYFRTLSQMVNENIRLSLWRLAGQRLTLNPNSTTCVPRKAW